jgi:hypothetical protein
MQRNCCEYRARTQRQTDKRGEWRVSIAGSRASENWEMRGEGLNGFERTYTLGVLPESINLRAIRRLILRLVPTGSS